MPCALQRYIANYYCFQNMEWSFHLLLLAASLLQVNCVNIYYIHPDQNLSDNITHRTLQEFINDTGVTSPYVGQYGNSKLLLSPGIHFLQSDFVICNATNFIMHGNDSKIYCEVTSLGITFINVTNISLSNIEVINCGKDYTLQSDRKGSINSISKSAFYFNQCTDVNLRRVSIKVHSGINGIIAININAFRRSKTSRSVFQDITITANCIHKTSPWPSSGIFFYYHNHHNPVVLQNCVVELSNYKYKTTGSCQDLYALNIATNQTLFNVSINVFNTNFDHLNNASVLNYQGESCGALIKSFLKFVNCSITHNQGNNHLNLFFITISNHGYSFSSSRYNVNNDCNKKISIIGFTNCAFARNSNMKSILYILLQNSLSANVLIDIRGSNFTGNNDTQIITVKSKVKILWQLTHYIILMNVRILSNRHNTLGHSLISSANGLIKLLHYVIIKNNAYHKALIRLYFSVLRFDGYSEFSSNYVYFVLDTTKTSYCLLKEHAKINVTKNFVYFVMSEPYVLNDELKPICPFQFVSNQTDLENESILANYHIDFTDNTYAAPKYYVEESKLYYGNCTWLKDTAFSSTNSLKVFEKVITETMKYETNITLLTICPCVTYSVYNCSQRYIGTVSPGQTLTIKLRLTTAQPLSTTLIKSFTRTKNIPEACQLLNAFEIEQVHHNLKCHEHNFTIWSEESECELYLSVDKITETLYVKLSACPAGFVLCTVKKTCNCDRMLYPYIASCNLNDETVLRLANGWIFAYKVNEKYEYKISKRCPYDYCVPHPSHLKLSMPDSQCQFHRTGLLCGQCQLGLSTVFGSSQCKQCSNLYLFIIIPIAIAGVVLVMFLFTFNITVTNGIINTFIFYVNIISINYSLLFPECHSIDCLLLSLSNLDLGFEVCFYNGMDDYAKGLLQLAFPFYLIFIAFALIISSRYSAKIQRLTSQRALPILATLFLLSYTKFLLTVCQVLFFYSEIIHLPSKHAKVVWSLDVSVPLFGVRFLIAFLICLVIFIILLYFNFLLLFARKLLRFKCISTFKPLLDAYFGPYKDKHYYWTGLQLILRAIFFSLSALHRNVNLTSGIIVLGIALCLQGLLRPFKSRYKNIQETFVLFNLQAVYALALYSNSDRASIQIMQVLILLVLIYFFIMITYHCLMSTSLGNKIIISVRNKVIIYFGVLKDIFFASRYTSDAIDLKGTTSNRVSGNYHEFQEPLVAIDD